MRHPLRSYEVLWTSGLMRCVLAEPEVVPQTYFLQVHEGPQASHDAALRYPQRRRGTERDVARDPCAAPLILLGREYADTLSRPEALATAI